MWIMDLFGKHLVTFADIISNPGVFSLDILMSHQIMSNTILFNTMFKITELFIYLINIFLRTLTPY